MKTFPRSIIRFIAGNFRSFLPLLVLIAGAVGCQKKNEKAVPPPPEVSVAAPLEKEIVEWNEYTGRLDSVEGVEVRPRVGGFLEAINFTEGQPVKEGDLLFEIDPRPFAAEVARAEAKLEQSKAAASLAAANLDRAADLVKKNAIAKQEYDIRLSESQQGAADVQAAEAELDAARLQLGFTKVSAPISGIAGRQLVTRGNLVNGGTSQATMLTTVVPHDPIYVYFEMDEAAFMASVRRVFAGEMPGRGKGKLPVEMGLIDEKGYPHTGEINFVDNRLNQQTATMLVRGRFENPESFLTPGQFGRVRVPASLKHKALLIPDEAINSDQSVKFVWVVKENNEAERRKVELGSLQDGLRVVREGLAAGERLVVRGIQLVRPGAKVNPQPTEIEAAAGDAEADAK